MHITNAINSSKNYIYMSMKKTNNLKSHSSTVAYKKKLLLIKIFNIIQQFKKHNLTIYFMK
jgi:hypothetical protein